MAPKKFLLFRPGIIVPVAIAFLLSSSFPRRIGFYRFLLRLVPIGYGALPAYYPNGEDGWAFTFRDLYGDGDGNRENSKKLTTTKLAYRNRLWGQTALVTGANSGTGYETSLALARLGVNVTMACRNPSRCEVAAQRIREDPLYIERSARDRGITDPEELASYVTTGTVDTSSLQSVKRFCRDVLQNFRTEDKSLDMLFLNAGMPMHAPLEDGTNELSEDGIELTFATNVVGHHLMYKLLGPILRHQSGKGEQSEAPSRIVLTSSAASYDVRYPYKVATDLERLNGDPIIGSGVSHYAQSKLAQIYWARELTDRLGGELASGAMYVNAAHPGVVATGIWVKNTFSNKLFERLFHWLSSFWKPIIWTAEEGALTLLYLGTSVRDLEQQNIRGQYFHPQSELMTVHRHIFVDDMKEIKILQEKMWKFLDDLVADFAQ